MACFIYHWNLVLATFTFGLRMSITKAALPNLVLLQIIRNWNIFFNEGLICSEVFWRLKSSTKENSIFKSFTSHFNMVSLMVPNAENNSKRLEFFKSIFSFFAFEEKLLDYIFRLKKKETGFGFHWMKFPSQNAKKSNVRNLQSKKGVLGILHSR